MTAILLPRYSEVEGSDGEANEPSGVGLAAILAGMLLVGGGALAFQLVSLNVRQQALADAIGTGNVGAGQSLLDRGAPVNTPNRYGTPPLVLAIQSGRTEVVKLLLTHGARIDGQGIAPPLWYAAIRGNAEMVKLLLAHGNDANAVDQESGETPLFAAAFRSRKLTPDHEKTAIVKTLLAAGADPHAHVRSSGMTALMWAARHRQTVMVQSLIQHSADVNARSKEGMTVLMHAASGGDPTVVKLLLAHGADPTARVGRRRYTALDLARKYGKPSVVPLLELADERARLRPPARQRVWVSPRRAAGPMP